MAKARPLRSPAAKAPGKASKVPATPSAARKPAAVEASRPRAALAPTKAAKPALRSVDAIPQAAVPPPLPAPIASFTF